MMNCGYWHSMVVAVAAALAVSACGDDGNSNSNSNSNSNGQGGANSILQCQAGGGYAAFDSANYANQDIRVGAYTEMVALLGQAAHATDNATARALVAQARDLYTDAAESANFQAKVQGRKDDHLASQPNVGAQLDATVMQWLDFGANAATTALQMSVVKQWVDKTLQEFFFLSVYHEMGQGKRSNWDEAFGYFSSGPNNAEADLRGLAATAHKRDNTNGTTLRATIFNHFIDGSCELARALDAAGTEVIDPASVPTLQTIIDDADLSLQKVFAFSAGHEAFEMLELDIAVAEDRNEFWVKMTELTPFVTTLLRVMEAAGGDSAARAATIQRLLDLADYSDVSDANTAWMTPFWAGEGGVSGPQLILDLIEAEYGISVQG